MTMGLRVAGYGFRVNGKYKFSETQCKSVVILKVAIDG